MLLLQASWFRLLLETGPIAKLILLVLTGFSMMSWAVMWDRWRAFREAEADTHRYLEMFRGAQALAQVRDQNDSFRSTPLAALFRTGFQELAQVAPRRGEPARPEVIALGMRNLGRGLERATRDERGRLERGMGFLATTASVTPFIGLLGTVWGIMNAFHGIGLTGNANLAVVAPGIAEALINTAAGLAAAIPAVLGYNHFLSRLRRMGAQMDNFASELTGRADRLLNLRGESERPGAPRAREAVGAPPTGSAS